MLDERLKMAADMYTPCEWGADVGTDHGLLPCYLLSRDICHHMIAADVSPKALQHARDNLQKRRLMDRAEVVLADGLDAITRPCGCISIMGMGGETLSGILTRGRDRLQGAALVLSAHTELPMVRRTLHELGFVILQERLCMAGGRYYILWQAAEGESRADETAIRYGSLLWQEDTALLAGYCAWRVKVISSMLRGLKSAAQPDDAAIARLEADVAFYQLKLTELEGK